MSCGCNHSSQSDLKTLSQEDLAREASHQLQQHMSTLSRDCLAKHGELNSNNLESFLMDRDCVRHPTRIVFDNTKLGSHQFAQPEWELKENEQGFVLYLHSALKDDPKRIILAVSYMLSIINYGEVVEDKHCALFGSAITGIPLAQYVDQIIELADSLNLSVA